ncbi:hypothetical protein Tco_1177322 [Tanacetum coccineum]
MTQLATTVDQRLTTVDRWLTGGLPVVRGTVHPRWQVRGGRASNQSMTCVILRVSVRGRRVLVRDTGLLWSLSVFIRSTVIWERVHDFQLGIESYQQKVNLTAPTMTFPGIEDHEMFSIIYEPVHGIIYKNSKKEKRVMRHSEIHKFCDATLNRVLEGLKSYNNDIKYGYVQKDLTKDEAEYLKLFEEEIEERLKHRRQMRRWEMFVNGRPLGPRRERPE